LVPQGRHLLITRPLSLLAHTDLLGERGDTFNAVQQAFSLGWGAHDENENTQKRKFLQYMPSLYLCSAC